MSSNQPQWVVQLALPVPLRRLFDYRPPAEVGVADVSPGMRMRVPFGRRQLVGVVMATQEASSMAPEKLRAALALLDQKPILEPETLALLRWCSDYYQHPIGEVVCGALPPRLRQGADPDDGSVPELFLTEAGQAVELDSLGRAHRQRSILTRLRSGPVSRSDLLAAEGDPHSVLKALTEKGWIAQRQVLARDVARQTLPGPPLTEQQLAAVDQINHMAGKFGSLLIDGVTGSGKTEVYLQAAMHTLEKGGQVMVLVPEIGLTPQFLRRIRQRLPTQVAVYHSAMGEGERARGWWAAASGRAGVLVGTRSAVFTPMPKLGLIVVDEEHDGSFKQQEGFRYHGRDVAVMRAHREQIPVVMGSATPALETLHNAAENRYQSLHLPRRDDQPPAPPMRVVDLRGGVLHEGLGEPLIAEIDRHLSAQGQVILFLNRRGFAPVLMCHSCGWHARCHRCEAHTTVHRTPPRLTCHHCGHTARVPLNCPECDQADLLHMGEGTERLEAFLSERFAQIPVIRVDRDSTRARGSLEAIFDKAREGEPCILVGTQMLAKGHHLPRVTLAAIVNIDQALFGSDFRATERAAQLVVQVAGRAGRSDAAGEVVLQTHHPDHPLIDALTRSSYATFAASEMATRKAAGFPPFSHMALMRAEAHQRADAEGFLTAAAGLGAGQGVDLWGPVSAPMERRAGRFRFQLLLRSDQRPALHRFLHTWLPEVEGLKEGRKVRWSLDVDPQDML